MDEAEKVFKRSMKEFKEAVWNSRHFIEPENDNEVVHRLIETLVVQVADVRIQQAALEVKLD